MNTQEIPLTPDNQQFRIDIAGETLLIRTLWRDGAGWIMDLIDDYGQPLILGIPLVSGVNLLAQYPHLGINAQLVVTSDKGVADSPGIDNLGVSTHLLAVTESS